MNELEVVSHACHHAKQPEWPRLKVGPIPISNCHCTATRENARISGFHIAAAEMFALNSQSEILASSLGDESEAGTFRERLSNNSLASLQSAIAPMAKTKEITMTTTDAGCAMPSSLSHAALWAGTTSWVVTLSPNF